jgi:hypothetical protein
VEIRRWGLDGVVLPSAEEPPVDRRVDEAILVLCAVCGKAFWMGDFHFIFQCSSFPVLPYFYTTLLPAVRWRVSVQCILYLPNTRVALCCTGKHPKNLILQKTKNTVMYDYQNHDAIHP